MTCLIFSLDDSLAALCKSRNSFIPAKQPFSRSVLRQRKVTINDFFTLLLCLCSPLLPSVTTLDEEPWTDNPEIYNVTGLQSLLSHELILMAALNPFIRTFYYSASQALSDFQWSCENIKRQSKLTLSSQIIISSLWLSSNFLTLKFSLKRDLRTTHHHWRIKALLGTCWLEFPAAAHKASVFPPWYYNTLLLCLVPTPLTGSQFTCCKNPPKVRRY